MRLYIVLLILLPILYTNAQNLVPKEKKGKWGYTETGTNKFKIKPAYDQVLPFGEITEDNKALVKQKGKWGVIDLKGKFLAKPAYDTIYVLQKERKAPGKSITIRIAGVGKTPATQHNLGQHLKLNSDFIVFSNNQQLGLLAKKEGTYQEVLLPQYSKIEFAVAEYDIFRLSNQEEKIVLFNAKSNTLSEPIEKYEVDTKRRTHHLINNYGFIITQNKLRGLMNLDFKITIKPQYEEIIPFKNKIHLKAYKKSKIGVIDTSGKVILPFEFERVEKQREYLLAQKDRLWGIYTMQGIQIAPCLYKDIAFKERQNAFLVQKENLWGFLDTKGQEIILCEQNDIKILTEDWLDEGVDIPIQNFDEVINHRLHQEFEEYKVAQIKAYIMTAKNEKKSLWILENGKARKLNNTEYDYISLLEEEGHAKERNIGMPRLFVLSMGKDKKTIQRGIMDDREQILIPIKYRNYYMPNKRLIVVESIDKAGLFDTQGSQLLPVEYDAIRLNDANQQEIYLQKGKKSYIWNLQTQKMTETTKSENEKK